MINLLSDEKKTEIRAGRANVIVLNYIFMLLAAVGLLLVILVGAYVTLNVTRSDAQNRVKQNTADADQYKATENKAKAYRDNLATAKQILEKEVLYSRLMTKIAQAVPQGVVLDQLSLNSTTIGTPTTINAHAKTQSAAVALKASFEKQTSLFSDVHFEQIQFEESGGGAYPVAVTLGLTISKAALQ